MVVLSSYRSHVQIKFSIEGSTSESGNNRWPAVCSQFTCKQVVSSQCVANSHENYTSTQTYDSQFTLVTLVIERAVLGLAGYTELQVVVT